MYDMISGLRMVYHHRWTCGSAPQEDSALKYSIPYGDDVISFDTFANKVLFEGDMVSIPPVCDFKSELLRSLDSPIASVSLATLAKGKRDILILVEDNTRDTPLTDILPVVTDYLKASGVPASAIRFMIAHGTHRLMTDEEIRKKLGDFIVDNFTVYQHEAADANQMEDLGEIEMEGYNLPVRINRRALEADLLIGIGNIIPHSDAGFSGGAKIVQPGICDFVTTQATHRSAGFCPDIPLGMLDGNPCRAGIDAVGRVAKLAFIINVVKNCDGEVAGFFCGDYMKAHRAGVELSRKSYSVELDELADIVIVSSSPADMDYWQGIKGLTSAYFAVKQGGAVILAAPCYEGLAHNHPLYAHWLAQPTHVLVEAIQAASPHDLETDIISAVVALGSRRTLERAEVYMVSDGLSDQEIRDMGYTPTATVQEALDAALTKRPEATIGILPLGGISLPFLAKNSILKNNCGD